MIIVAGALWAIFLSWFRANLRNNRPILTATPVPLTVLYGKAGQGRRFAPAKLSSCHFFPQWATEHGEIFKMIPCKMPDFRK